MPTPNEIVQASWVDKSPSARAEHVVSARRPTWVSVTPGAVGAGERISDLIQADMVAKNIPWYSVVAIVFLSESRTNGARTAVYMGDTAAVQERVLPAGEDVYIPASEISEMFVSMAAPAAILLEVLYA